MKALVLENGLEQDIPKTLINYLKRNKIDWKWFDMRERFWPENEKETIKFFSNLPKNKLLICSTVFDGFQQLELMIELLYQLKEKEFTFQIMHNYLCQDLIDFYENDESSITPRKLLDEYDNCDLDEIKMQSARKKILDFKSQMNEKFLQVLQHHNIHWINRLKDGLVLFKTLEDIKINKPDY